MRQWLKVIGGYSVEQIGGFDTQLVFFANKESILLDRRRSQLCICRLDGSHSRAMACPLSTWLWL
ncbi:hypothetical protein BYT27DRAFT_7205204 [Phlegmacium glaucopus]|nr:hypothetical protein BYT27DRAFT_7205204 [Phlegmacium glaucopus]